MSSLPPRISRLRSRAALFALARSLTTGLSIPPTSLNNGVIRPGERRWGMRCSLAEILQANAAQLSPYLAYLMPNTIS